MEVAVAADRNTGSRGIPLSLLASIPSEDFKCGAGSDFIMLTPSPSSSPLTASSGVVSSAEDDMEQQSGDINEFQTISKKRTRDDDVEAILLAAAAAGTPKGKCKDLVMPPCVKTPRRDLRLANDDMGGSVLSAVDTPKAENDINIRQNNATPQLRDIIQELATPTRLGDESAHDYVSDQGSECEVIHEEEPPASPTFLSHEIYIIHENDGEDSCFMAPSPAKQHVNTPPHIVRWGHRHRRMSDAIRRHVISLEEFMERKSGGPADFDGHSPPLEVYNECRSALVSAIQTLAPCLSQLTDSILKRTAAIHSHPLMGLVLSLETFIRDVERLSKENFFPLVKGWIAAASASRNLCEMVKTLVEGDVTLKEESWVLRGSAALLKLANIARIYSSRGPPLLVRLLRKEVEDDANVLMEAIMELCHEKEVYKVEDLENDAKELQRRFSMLRGHPAEIEAGICKLIQLNKSIKPGDVVLRAVQASGGNLAATFQLSDLPGTTEGTPEISACWSLSVLFPTINRISNALLAQTQPWTSPIIIQGTSGVGKSISVAAAIRRHDVNARFAGGVFWVTMKGKTDLDVDWALEDLALKVTKHRIGLCDPRALTDAGTPWAPSLPTTSRVLTQLSMEASRLSAAGYEALIVLDGLHDTQVLEALRPLGFHILAIMAVLPDRHILPDTFDVLQIEALKIEEALSFISTVSATEQSLLCLSAKSVANLCRGLPMALYMMAKCAGKREAADEDVWSTLEKEMQRDLKADDSQASCDPDRAVIRAATKCCLRRVSSDIVRNQYLSLSILPDSYPATGLMLRAVWGNCSVSTCSATCSELESLGMLHPVANTLHACDSPSWRHSLHFLYPIQAELIREEATKCLDLPAKAAACQTFFLAEARILQEAQDIPMSHDYIYGGRRGLHMCWKEVEQGFSFNPAEAHAQMMDETRAINKEGIPNRSSAQGTFMITLGDFYFCRSDYSLSLELYREGCTIASGTSQHAYALQGVARCFAVMGRIPEAMRRFRKGMSALDQDEGKNGGRNVMRWARDLVEMCMISSNRMDTTVQDSLLLLMKELRRGEMVVSHCSTLLELIGGANDHPATESHQLNEAKAYWGQFVGLWKDAFLAQPKHPRIGLALGTGRYLSGNVYMNHSLSSQLLVTKPNSNMYACK